MPKSTIATGQFHHSIEVNRTQSRSFCERNRTFAKGRFSEKEKAILWQAAMNFAAERGMGLNEVERLFSKKRLPQLRGAWSKIGTFMISMPIK
jgi:hypothetical protein